MNNKNNDVNSINTSEYRLKSIDNGKEKNSLNIIKSIIACAITAAVTVAICFNIPEIKEKLFSSSSEENNETASILPINIENQDNSKQTISISYEDIGPVVASKVLPSVVGIQVTYNVNSIFGTQNSATASGSGIIISSDGYIVTNNHVVSSSDSNSFYSVSEATGLKVFLYGDDKNGYDAEIIGTDKETDLAVIKINKTGLTPAEIGNSNELKIGEWAMAIGNPLGLTSSISIGAISAVNREITDEQNKKYTILQTDAAINSGNSGGALVNSKGQVIGINFMKISSVSVEGISFALPITPSMDIINQLTQYNKVKRPYLGISGATVTENISKRYNLAIGVYVQEVDTFAKAASAGLKSGDVITKIDDKDIKTMEELSEYIKSKKIGDKVTLKINRDGKEMEIKCELSEQP